MYILALVDKPHEVEKLWTKTTREERSKEQ
jgi:hypothetical protein